MTYAGATHILRTRIVIVPVRRVSGLSLVLATARAVDLRESSVMENMIDEGQTVAWEQEIDRRQNYAYECLA